MATNLYRQWMLRLQAFLAAPVRQTRQPNAGLRLLS